MDVSFSNVLEGTRQYFQGLPKATSNDQAFGNNDISAAVSQPSAPDQNQQASSEDVLKSASPTMANSRPPSAAMVISRPPSAAMATSRPPSATAATSRPPSVAMAPSPVRPPPAPSELPEPSRPPSEGLLEPKPHFIHKATVMQQAQKKQQESYLNPIQDLERPPSIHLISPPTHIIPKPLHCLSIASIEASKSNRITPQEDIKMTPHFLETSGYNAANNNSARDIIITTTNPATSISGGGYKSSHIPTPPQPSIQDMMNYQSRNQQRMTSAVHAQQSRHSISNNFQHSYPRPISNVETRYPPSSQTSHHAQDPNSQYYYTSSKQMSTAHLTSHRIPKVSHLPNSQILPQSLPSYKTSTPYSSQSNIVHCHRESSSTREQSINNPAIQRTTHNVHQTAAIPQNSRVPPIMPHIIPTQHPSHVKPTQYNSGKVPDQPSYVSSINQQSQRHHYAYDNSIQGVRKTESREYAYALHSNHYRTATNAVAHGSQQNIINRTPSYPDSRAATDRYHSSSSSSYLQSAKSHVNVHQQYLSSKPLHSSSLQQHEYHSSTKHATMPTNSQIVKAPTQHPAYRLPPVMPSASPNYAQGLVSTSSVINNGSHYHQQPYQVTSVLKQAYETPVKQSQPVKTVNKPNCPSQRMTVSVQSLVNQMNVMRKQQSSKPDSIQPQVNQKKESPLDLSVKTLKIPADSTRQDDTESVSFEKTEVISRKPHILPLREPPVVSYASNTSNTGHSLSTNTSHKVDFLPNFNSSYVETQHYQTTSVQPRLQTVYHPEYVDSFNNRSKSIYPDSANVHGTNNYHPNVIKENYSSLKRIDHSLPRIDLTVSLGKDCNNEQINGSQPVYVREDCRKRYLNNPINNIPEKIVRYETWSSNSRIEKHNINKDINNVYPSNKPINGSLYDCHQYKHENLKNEKLSDQIPSNTSYSEAHSNQFHGQYRFMGNTVSDIYNKYMPRENGSRYLTDRQYSHKHLGSKISATVDNIDTVNSGSPADKRVLSILRNSLEVKSGIEPSRIIHNLDEPIVIDHDDPEPEINNFIAVKENLVDKSQLQPLETTIKQSDPVARKLHMPKAVDSIRYDSDSKSSSYDDIQIENLKHTDDHSSLITSNNCSRLASEIDVAAVLAARIRTKAELKGFTLPREKSEEKQTINNEPTSLPEKEIIKSLESKEVIEPVRRRLFSKDKNEEQKQDLSNIRKSNDTSVFDFEDSQPEDSQKHENLHEEPQKHPNIVIKVEKPDKLDIIIKEEPLVECEANSDVSEQVKEKEETEDPFWTETCQDFIEQLKNGSAKKKVKKKNIDLELSPVASVDILKDPMADYKIDRSVVNVVDIIKSESSGIPFIIKIKEELKEMDNIKVEPESTDDDEPLINCKHLKNKLIPTVTDSGQDLVLNVPNIVIKVEPEETINNTKQIPETQDDIKSKTKIKQKIRIFDSGDLNGRKQKQETTKKPSQIESSSDETDSDDNVAVCNRLRVRKCTSEIKCDENKNKMSKDSPKKKDDKNLLRKPGFGDGSDFRPGWEEEVYRYKRSLRMPSRLINVPNSPHWQRISSSLPDLDPSSPAPSSSTTDEIYSRQKYATSGCDIADKCKDIDSDIESNYSFSANQKVGYDSEASCSTVFSFVSKTAKKKENGTSILDLLIQKCGKKDDTKKKNKDDSVKPKLIPKSNNTLELLETPSLGIEKSSKLKGDSPGKKEKIMEDLFYLGSFRKQTVSNFRDAFINNTDGLIGATEEFSPVVFKSRTRTETRVMKQRTTIREVFGDERPASAPPSSCLNEDLSESKCEDTKLKLPVMKKVLKCSKKTLREGLRSSRILRRSDGKGPLLRQKKRNGLLNAFKNKKHKIGTINSKIKKEHFEHSVNQKSTENLDEPTTSPLNKKRFRKLFSRRKFSSGFDYIRKKKKIIKKEDDIARIPRKSLIKTTPESVQDIQKEIKGWIINKGIGETVLHRAARLGFTDCVAYCLEKMDLPPSAKDNAGYTALHEASSRGHLQIAKILLQYGANVSEAAQGGIRPLHEACENEHIEIIRLLLSYGADPLLATYSGQTPVKLAEGEAAKYLRLHIADTEGTSSEPWHFEGPSKIFDPVENGCDVLSIPPPPSSSPPPPSPPIEISSTHQPLPSLYTLKPGPGEIDATGPWCLLSDLSNILQVKSRDSLLKQIHIGQGSHRDSLCELRMQDFLERAICHQLMAAGEKINIRASKISLVKYTNKVKELLDIETTVIR